MSTTDQPEKATPPYIPFSTLANFIERLKSTAVPEKIDNSLLLYLAGGIRGSVRSALRFLGLTDAQDHVNTTFHDLIQAHGTESWGPALGAVIDSAYVPILNGLDLTRATPNQLTTKFKASGLTGQMGEKAIRFLLAAFESAGRPFSPHLKVRAVSSGPRPRRPSKATADREREESEEEPVEGTPSHPPGVKVRSFSFPIPGEPDIRVVIPEKLDDADIWSMVDATVRTYIRLNAKAQARATGQEGGSG